MRNTNNIIAIFFILLLSFQQVRIANYSSSFDFNKSYNSEKSQVLLETQNIFFCNFSDQKQGIQNYLESVHKLLLKISLPHEFNYSSGKYVVEKKLDSIYIIQSCLIIPSLETNTIIFPFHNFW